MVYMATDIETMTPTEIDNVLADFSGQEWQARGQLAELRNRKAKKYTYGAKKGLPMYDQADLDARIAKVEAALEVIFAEAAPYEAEFVHRGGWTRAFLVTSSDGGHVHSSMACSTCRWETKFSWRTEYSAKPEAEIVEAAGERACTVCYPSAPVEVRSRPTTIFSEDERQAQVDREARNAAKAAKAADKAAKAIFAPDGSPLKIMSHGRSERIDNERAARIEAGDQYLVIERGWTEYREPAAGQQAKAEAEVALAVIVEALAAKLGLTPEEMLAELAPAFARKLKAYDKENARWKAYFAQHPGLQANG